MRVEQIVIADAGPFIALYAIERLELLRGISHSILVPRAVRDEIAAGAPRPGSVEIEVTPWIHISEGPVVLTSTLELMIDRGEAAAIALAQSMPGSLLLIDEQRARKLAAKLGVRFTGTLGVLSPAHRRIAQALGRG
jgi:predicted nucleic acid-binding protein